MLAANAQLLLALALIPISLWVHELGHALAALLLTPGRVTISVGDCWQEQPYYMGERRRLTLRCVGWQLLTGYCEYECPPMGLKRKLLVTGSGPLASLIFALAVLATTLGVGLSPWITCGAAPLFFTGVFLTDGPRMLETAWPYWRRPEWL